MPWRVRRYALPSGWTGRPIPTCRGSAGVGTALPPVRVKRKGSADAQPLSPAIVTCAVLRSISDQRTQSNSDRLVPSINATGEKGRASASLVHPESAWFTRCNSSGDKKSLAAFFLKEPNARRRILSAQHFPLSREIEHASGETGSCDSQRVMSVLVADRGVGGSRHSIAPDVGSGVGPARTAAHIC